MQGRERKDSAALGVESPTVVGASAVSKGLCRSERHSGGSTYWGVVYFDVVTMVDRDRKSTGFCGTRGSGFETPEARECRGVKALAYGVECRM